MEGATVPSALLLLPAPTSFRRASLRAACGPTLSSLLPFVAQSVKGTNNTARLDVAVVLPEFINIKDTPRVILFAEIQSLLTELYTLLCVIAIEHGVELDLPGGVDARIFMLEAIRETLETSVNDVFSGPLIDMATLVASRARIYDPIFSIESEEGEHILQTFLKLYSVLPNPSPPNVRRMIGGTSITTSSQKPDAKQTAPDSFHPPPTHHSVAVGGTFDHLHIGHKLLLTATALVLSPTTSPNANRLITVGITGDELLVNKKFASEVESWDVRQQKTADFFESILAFPTASASSSSSSSSRRSETISEPGPNGHVVRVTFRSTPSGSATTINYTRISDPYGPTITDEKISALVISQETRAGGMAVNDKRRANGWAELDVFEVDVLDASPRPGDDGDVDGFRKETFESKISSTEIRRRLAETRAK
jgi:phosphopantetheine adenylyltransferase